MPEACAVEHAGHADNTMMRQARSLLQSPHHRVERVRNDDHEGVGSIFLDALAHLLHDLEIDVEKVIAAHAWLARHASGNDTNVGAFNVRIGVGALERDVETLDPLD